uniref:Uncharacterized protein n=1 Tax=Setaria viridis TaxID=4556 RepID=A0A4U6SW97_SETVI|nr:hypothetical protein SEVIR_9G170450v2 [Setaria viridis]
MAIPTVDSVTTTDDCSHATPTTNDISATTSGASSPPPGFTPPRVAVSTADAAQQDGAADKDLEKAKRHAFTAAVHCKLCTPLAPRPTKMKRAGRPAEADAKRDLPKRSEHLANHPLANVASSKRVEVVLVRWFKLIPEAAPPTSEGRQAYAKLHKAEMVDRHFEAVRDLLPPLRHACPALGMQA